MSDTGAFLRDWFDRLAESGWTARDLPWRAVA